MNEKVDLTKILKNCPKGFKLYSPMVGEVEFERILDGRAYPIITSYNERTLAFTNEGFYYDDAGAEAECLLFPTAEQRDWRKFKAPWYKKEMDINSMSNKDDERLRKTVIAFLKDFAEQGYENAVECIDWLEKQGEQASSQTNEELIREWTIQDAKDGDILACNEEILLFKSYSALQGRISLYCWYNGHTNNFHSKEVIDILLTTRNKVCPATKEQRDLLFQKIKEAGYKWNYETKTLEKLIKPKFNPKTLQPFDRVLVKDGYSQCWRCNLFSHTETEYPMFPYNTHVGHFYYCIPYNEDTKHLVGTTEEVPEYYKYWED